MTERVLAEQAFEANAGLLLGISDSSVDMVFAKDHGGCMRFANPAALAFIGKPAHEVIGKTDAEFLEDKEAARQFMEDDRRIMDSGIPATVEEIIERPDGTQTVWLTRKAPRFDADGRVVGVMGVSRNITDHKQSWDRINRLHEVAAALSEAVTREDVARVTVHQAITAVGAISGLLTLLAEDSCSLKVVDSVGYPPEVIRPGQHFSLDAPFPLAETVRSGRPIYIASPEEQSIRYPGLSLLAAHPQARSWAILPLTIGGRTVGSLGLSFSRSGEFSANEVDFMISMGRQCAQALERARLYDAERTVRADAEHSSRMKDEFLATLSHELRTPLNAILGWATILARGTSSKSVLQDGLETIKRNAGAQTKIIEDLLHMSRIISGKARLEVSRTNLVHVLREAVETIRPTAEAKGIELRIVLPGESVPISADGGRLQQVLWNLLSNAIKFTPKGGQVTVSIYQNDSSVEVTVADTGEGILTEFLPYVFDRFRQVDSSVTRRHGGLGIGLAIVKQLIELHGGTVGAVSGGLNQGATFKVVLPQTSTQSSAIHEVLDMCPPAVSGGEPPRTVSCTRLTGVRVLVVDDEPDARSLLKHVLEECDAVVRTAASAQEAIARIAQEPPDILVSDIGMPVEDGYALIRYIRALNSKDGGDVPAIALTAYARPEDRAMALSAGYQSHVVKPFEADQLVMVIANLTGVA